jgi:hypothetical protein
MKGKCTYFKSMSFTLGCTKKHNNMCWQLFPILLEPLSKNMPFKMFSDYDISNM